MTPAARDLREPGQHNARISLGPAVTLLPSEGDMLDHLSLGVRDLDRSTTFYATVLGTLGYRLQRRLQEEVAFGPGEQWTFFLYPAAAPQPVAGARMHVAFRAQDRDAVRAFYARALGAGGAALPDREPAERPQFGTDYFGAVLTDPDGHVLEVLTRAP
jgi:catechol 2,3-dioxygenase-like lactoylglutathione lyase family enzyme